MEESRLLRRLLKVCVGSTYDRLLRACQCNLSLAVELTLENVVLKKAIGNDDLADRLTLFERSMREERLVTSNLKKKLKKAKEQNETLVQKLHKLAEHNVNEQLVTVSSGNPNRLGLDKNIVMLQREKSQSMNDLKSTEKPKEQERGAATPNYQRSSSLK